LWQRRAELVLVLVLVVEVMLVTVDWAVMCLTLSTCRVVFTPPQLQTITKKAILDQHRQASPHQIQGLVQFELCRVLELLFMLTLTVFSLRLRYSITQS
jgi:hypothetical protein